MSDLTDKDELIDPSKMTQREMLLHVYRAVAKIELSIAEDRKDVQQRLKTLEDSDSQKKGVRIGLSIAVTILSIAAFVASMTN